MKNLTMASKKLLINEFKKLFFQTINVNEEDFFSFSNFFSKRKYSRKAYLLHAGDKWD